MTKRLFEFIVLMLLPAVLLAQVTTSSMSGVVRSSAGDLLEGASVKAVHTPTGTTYSTVSRKAGVFNIPNMIPGGPYSIQVSHVGFEAYEETGLNFSLGENIRYDADLKSTSTELTNVVVSAQRGGASSRRKTGASTSIGKDQLARLPTLSRSLADFTRTTPQANGNSFGGMSNKFNNITIDGAVNNDVFGLSSSGTPGGSAATTPISLDAIQEIQVVLAPYDITYGNFTGGGVNAVTRSGTNNLEGSVYYFTRSQAIVGKEPIAKTKTNDFTDKQYGIRLGGAIVKNKLFFFANAELARREAPTILNAGEERALITREEAAALASTVQNKYGYDVGTADVFDAKTQSDKFFGRIDWNISSKHRLTLRHNYISAFDDNNTRSSSLFRFGNNTYRFNNKQNISVAELRSRFSNTVSNNLIVGLHRIRDSRSIYGTLFPSVEISHDGGTIQLGSERSSTANELDQNIFEVTDNLKIFKGKHTITFGTHNEFFKFRNLFINNLNGRWRFASMDDFTNDFPRQFDVTYSANKAANARPATEFKAAQLGFYVQDEVQFNPKFRLTYGLRVDVPILPDKPTYNAVIDSTFGGKYSTQNVPNGQLLWSPRLGFNYDVEGDRSLIVRGGLGIFSGRVPFVWISNQYGNTGTMLRTTAQTDNTPTSAPFLVNDGNGFDPNVDNQSNIGNAGNSFEANLMDKDFKLPQVFRMNLGIDAKLPGDINATIDFIYSKTINNVFYQDVNLTEPVGTVDPAYNNGFDDRIAYASTTNDRRINPNITNAIFLSNTSKGYAYNIGFTLSKTFRNLYTQLSYNHNGAADVNSGASSTAVSNWEFVQVVGNPNAPGLTTSNYALPHRLLAMVSYGKEYIKHLKTTISLFYSGNSGQRFTYLVNGDLNSDGRFGNDLLYVPANASEITFIDLLQGGQVRYTAQQQSDAFMAFIDNDKYLRKHKGGYTSRNAASTPWEHVVDARIAQDFFIKAGSKRHSLQLTFDVFNLTNLISSDWGRQFTVTNQAYNLLTTVSRTGEKGYNYTPNSLPWSMSFGSRWQGQIGIRYTFE